MNCKECANRPKLGKPKDEQYYVDIIDAMAERTNRRSHVLNIILSVMLTASIIVIVLLNNARVEALNAKIDAINELRELERSIETVYEYEYSQEADDNSNNYIVGGDYYGGKAESENKEDDTP